MQRFLRSKQKCGNRESSRSTGTVKVRELVRISEDKTTEKEHNSPLPRRSTLPAMIETRSISTLSRPTLQMTYADGVVLFLCTVETQLKIGRGYGLICTIRRCVHAHIIIYCWLASSQHPHHHGKCSSQQSFHPMEWYFGN